MKKATIQDVAAACGVSTATVSRCINQSGFVGADTAAKIAKAIEKLHYTPNQLAVNLTKKRSNLIGMLVPDICNSFFSEVYYGASRLCEENGYHLMLLNTDEDPQTEKAALQSLISQQICGLIVTPVCEENEATAKALRQMASHRMPIVFLDRKISGIQADGVFVDNEAATGKAVELLIENGHRDIAVIAGPQTTVPGRERLNGFFVAMKNAGLPVRAEWILQGNFRAQDSYRAVKTVLEKPGRPTAIFSCNNTMTLGAIRAITECGLAIPRDIALVSFDDITLLEELGIPITAVRRATYEMGQVAMQILLQRLRQPDGKEYSVQHTVLRSKMVLRGSEQFIKK